MALDSDLLAADGSASSSSNFKAASFSVFVLAACAMLGAFSSAWTRTSFVEPFMESADLDRLTLGHLAVPASRLAPDVFPGRHIQTNKKLARQCTGYLDLPTGGTLGKDTHMHAGREGIVVQAADAVKGALLCDCDGTLVETERDGHRVSFNKAFKENGYENCDWTVELYGELLTTGGGKERMTRYFKDYNPEAWPHPDPPAKDHPAIMELHKLKTELFMDIVRAGELPLREGVKDLLAAADAAGWTLAVCSTSNEDAVKAVVETMLPQHAKSMRIFAGDMAKKKKPDPEIYNMASAELGISPSKCVVLEDTNIGMRAGKAAGMMVVVTKSIYSKDEDFADADLVVASAEDVDFTKSVKTMLPS